MCENDPMTATTQPEQNDGGKDRRPLGLDVEVLELLDAWMFAGGWADGPFVVGPEIRTTV